MTKSIEQFGFLGVLKGSNIIQLNDIIIEDLINRRILIENFADYGTPEYCPLYLNGFIYYHDQVFQFNPNILEELYSLINSHIETTSDYLYDLKPILYQLDSIIDRDKKIKFLKKCYKMFYPKDWQTYSIFIGNGSNGIQNWKDYAFLNLEAYPNLLNLFLTWEGEQHPFDVSDDIHKLIESFDVFHRFITTIYASRSKLDEDGFFELITDWKLYHEREKQLVFILDKIKELSNNSSKISKQSTLRELFSKPEEFDNLIKKLRNEDLIDKEGKIYNNHSLSGYKPIRLKACIGYQLFENNYLKTRENGKPQFQKVLVEALNNAFQDQHVLSESNYSDAVKTFSNTKPKDIHLDLLHFMNS